MYGNEKETLEHLAGLAGTDMTAFAKKRIFSDDKIIILDSGRYISRSLIEISDCLKAAQRENKISDDIYDRTYKKLCEILSEFISLSNMGKKESTIQWNCQEMCSQRIPKILDRQGSGSVMRELL